MTTVTFDTLKLAQNLRDRAKFSPEQAEQTAVVLAETFGDWATAATCDESRPFGGTCRNKGRSHQMGRWHELRTSGDDCGNYEDLLKQILLRSVAMRRGKKVNEILGKEAG